MTSGLQHYTITITAEGPLFVGSGQSIGKKEYLFHPRRNQVSIPDMGRLYRFLQEKRLTDAYESFMLNERNDFSDWLRTHHILDEQCRPWIAYTLDSGDAVFATRGKKEIATFVKDAYGCPYVPGSSLKGALRTALLAAMIMEQPQQFQRNRQEVRSARLDGRPRKLLKRETDHLEQEAFYTLGRDKETGRNAVNDILGGLRISDSAPLSLEDLTLCQKIDVLRNGNQRKLPILRECLKPGTELHFTLTIDPKLCPVTPKRMLHAAMELVSLYEKCVLQFFPMDDILGGGNLYLGGGCGFFSKTVLYPLLGERDGLEKTVALLHRQFPRHMHLQDRRLGVSPHTVKCAKYRGELYEMGACTMEVQPFSTDV